MSEQTVPSTRTAGALARAFHAARAYLAIAVVVGIFLWSAVTVYVRRSEEAPADAVVIRVGHWQLEAGVREAIDTMAAEFQKLHPEVRVIQDAIPEGTYGQWVSTQLMGGTAPDIIECGLGLPVHIWVSYYNRYFLPLTRYVNRPNPYNKGTDLEGVPLRKTFKDGMRPSYIEELQEYMTVPLSQHGIRVFYNKALLEQLTGLETPPTEYRAFLEVCRKIAAQKNDQGQYYIPIAGSRYHVSMWEQMMFNPLTYGLVREADFNRDGLTGIDEMYVAFKTDRINFESPQLRARFLMLRQITDQFQTGYTGLTRDEAVFLFAQQRAVFMSSGMWDAFSLIEQAEGTFPIEVMDFPQPRPDDPEFAGILEGPIYEKPIQGNMMAVTRTSKHPDIALEFLLFMAGQENNERLNKIIGWIPCIIGAEMEPFLKPFEPCLEGVYEGMNFNLGGETWIRYQQLYSLYQVNQISYDGFAKEFGAFYLERGLLDFLEIQKDWRRGVLTNEQLLAGMRAQALTLDGEEALSRWIKYRTFMASRQVWSEIGHALQNQLLDADPEAVATGPYEYSAFALARIRERAANAPALVEQGGQSE